MATTQKMRRTSPPFARHAYSLLKDRHLHLSTETAEVANILLKFENALAEPLHVTLEPYLKHPSTEGSAMEEYLRPLTDPKLRMDMEVFLFVLQENRLPLPQVDMMDDGDAMATWKKPVESLHVFFDADEGISTLWGSIEGGKLRQETKEYNAEDKDEQFLLYLKFKLNEMGF
ncbi:hypothetical protein HK104_010734 [Borealophlyctis nickersoniae]|nr:hypothetical protein HK104_010734 [Borealophlyctis nickersoniae]